MTTSVIIPHRDRPEHLARTLASIRSYWDGEVIVVDDGSRTDLGQKLAYQYHAFYSRLPVNPQMPGFRLSHTRNAGAALARGDLFFFNDVDIEHEPRAILRVEELAGLFRDPVVLPELVHRDLAGNITPTREHLFRKTLRGRDEYVLSKNWLYAWMGWAAVPRSTFQSVGGFDQSFWGWACDDMDWAYRAARVGFQFCYTRRALGIHWPHPDQPDKTASGRHAFQYFESKHGFPLPSQVVEEDGEVLELRRKA